MIQSQARSLPNYHASALVLKSRGQFLRSENTHVARGDTALSGDLPRPFVFIDVAATQLLCRQILFASRSR